MRIRSISDFRRAVRNGPYAWPGGYPLYWVMADGGALAFKNANRFACRHVMLEALRDGNDAQWRPVALEINWEDSELICDQTGEPIESAYA